MMIQQLKQTKFLNTLLQHTKEIYLVGGVVRDQFLGKIDSKDIDILICGLSIDELIELLKPFGKVDLVGKSFGVIKFVPIEIQLAEPVDFVLPRKEISTGKGYQDFEIILNKDFTVYDDLKRRDYSINAICQSLYDDSIIDPFNGIEDIKNKNIKVVSPKSFTEDPLRMLRGVIQATRFGFTIEEQTKELIKQNASSIAEISPERYIIEFDKLIKKGNPLQGLKLLNELNLFPYIFFGKPYTGDYQNFDKIKTIGEFLFLCLGDIRSYSSNSNDIENNIMNLFTKRFGSALDLKTAGIIRCLLIFNTQWTDNKVRNLFVLMKMVKVSREAIENSLLIPSEVKQLVNQYPTAVTELAINGNDLMSLGFKGKQIGDKQMEILTAIFSDKIKNDRQEIFNFLNPDNGTDPDGDLSLNESLGTDRSDIILRKLDNISKNVISEVKYGENKIKILIKPIVFNSVENLNLLIQLNKLMESGNWFLDEDGKNFQNVFDYYKTNIIKYKNDRKFKDVKNPIFPFEEYPIPFTYYRYFDKQIDNIPDILYHGTNDLAYNNIKINGLNPKSKNNASYYPSRIFFMETIDECDSMIDEISYTWEYKKKNNNQLLPTSKIILEIDTTKCSNLKLYKDPNSNGFYTYNSIPPNAIAVVKIEKIDNNSEEITEDIKKISRDYSISTFKTNINGIRKAIIKYLETIGVKYEQQFAQTTKSVYLKFDIDTVSYEIRLSNHTKAFTGTHRFSDEKDRTVKFYHHSNQDWSIEIDSLTFKEIKYIIEYFKENINLLSEKANFIENQSNYVDFEMLGIDDTELNRSIFSFEIDIKNSRIKYELERKEKETEKQKYGGYPNTYLASNGVKIYTQGLNIPSKWSVNNDEIYRDLVDKEAITKANGYTKDKRKEYLLNAIKFAFNELENKIKNSEIKSNYNSLTETITPDIIDLKKHITDSDLDKKIKDLPYEYFDRFYGILNDYFKEKDFLNTRPTFNSKEDINEFRKNYPDLYEKFCYILYDRLTEHKRTTPSFSLFGNKAEYIKNKWLIHYTDPHYLDEISSQGFMYNINKNFMNRVGYANIIDKNDKGPIGYTYAFDLDDVNNDNYSYLGKYGFGAVIFIGSGIKVYHPGDYEKQVIFWGPSVHNIFTISYLYDKGNFIIIKNKFKQKRFKLPEDLRSREAINYFAKWLKDNYRQFNGKSKNLNEIEGKIELTPELIIKDLLKTKYFSLVKGVIYIKKDFYVQASNYISSKYKGIVLKKEGNFFGKQGRRVYYVVINKNALNDYNSGQLSLFEGNDQLNGGKSDNMTLNDISKKHNVKLIDIKKQFLKGLKVEREHTSDKNKIKEIVMDHLFENPNYYDKLEKAGLADELNEGISNNNFNELRGLDEFYKNFNDEQLKVIINKLIPNSLYKDIVFHGTMEQLLPKEDGFKGYVTYFSTNKSYSETFGFPINRKIVPALINIKNPFYSKLPIADVPEEVHNKDYINPRLIKLRSNTYDSVIGIDAGQDVGQTIAVFNPSDIIILTTEQTKSRINQIISESKILDEADYSFHKGILPDEIEPYGGGTDMLYRMSGRGTGHFGSGTYLSTYKEDNGELKVVDTNKTIEKIHGNVYQIDLEKYKLYQPKTSERAELLFKTLKMINEFYFNYKNSDYMLNNYSKKNLVLLIDNLKILNLKFPKDFLKKLRDIDSQNHKASISTLFMEYNGYNGVNVNNINGWDNTLHGSVIYDLNKTINEPFETNHNSLLFFQNNWDKIIKDANNHIYFIDFIKKNFTYSQIIFILKQINYIINIDELKYMIRNNKLNEIQYNFIMKIYPNIAINKLKENPDLNIPYSTLILLLSKGFKPDENQLGDILYSIYKESNSKNSIVDNFIKTIDPNMLNDDDRYYFDYLTNEKNYG